MYTSDNDRSFGTVNALLCNRRMAPQSSKTFLRTVRISLSGRCETPTSAKGTRAAADTGSRDFLVKSATRTFSAASKCFAGSATSDPVRASSSLLAAMLRPKVFRSDCRQKRVSSREARRMVVSLSSASGLEKADSG